MKRAGRIVYRLLTALSLLLLLATAGVWVRSYWVSDYVDWLDCPEGGDYLRINSVRSARGGMQFQTSVRAGLFQGYREIGDFHHRSQQAFGYPFYDRKQHTVLPLNFNPYAALGFELVPEARTVISFRTPSFIVERSLTLPLYFLCLLFAILPAHFVLRLRRRRRIARRIALGCCIGCGYDLRASSGRCPECGRVGPAASG